MINTEITGNTGRITLNRPETHNALDQGAIAAA